MRSKTQVADWSGPSALGEMLHRLRPQARSILAVLTAAARWPERYPAGLVPIRELSESSRFITDNPTSIRQAVHRARQQFRVLPGVSTTVQERMHLRFETPPDQHLVDWLHESGWRDLRPEFWREFLRSAPAPDSPSDAMQTLDAIVARRLVLQGDCAGALSLTTAALRRETDPYHRAGLILVRVLALNERGLASDWIAAERLLREASRLARSGLTTRDRVVLCRVWVELAYTHLLALGREPASATATLRHLESASAWLDRSRPLEPALESLDRARILEVGGLLRAWEARSPTGSIRDKPYDEAEGDLLRSLSLYRATGDGNGVRNVMFQLGELCYDRSRLHRLPASEEPIAEAFTWYYASLQLSTRLGLSEGSALVRARLAELLGILAEIRFRLSAFSPHAERVRMTQLGQLRSYAALPQKQALQEMDDFLKPLCEHAHLLESLRLAWRADTVLAGVVGKNPTEYRIIKEIMNRLAQFARSAGILQIRDAATLKQQHSVFLLMIGAKKEGLLDVALPPGCPDIGPNKKRGTYDL